MLPKAAITSVFLSIYSEQNIVILDTFYGKKENHTVSHSLSHFS